MRMSGGIAHFSADARAPAERDLPASAAAAPGHGGSAEQARLRLGQQASFSKRNGTTLADHEVVQQAHIDQRQGLLQFVGDAGIGSGGFRITGRVVVAVMYHQRHVAVATYGESCIRMDLPSEGLK